MSATTVRDITKAIVQEIGKRDARIYELELVLSRNRTDTAELARLLSRLAGFAAHHAHDSAMAAGGRDLVAEARALLARVDGEGAP